jgi:hypothetical protein
LSATNHPIPDKTSKKGKGAKDKGGKGKGKGGMRKGKG